MEPVSVKKPYRLIMGKHCLMELLKRSPKRVVEIYTCQGDREDPIQELAAKESVSIRKLGRAELTRLVESESHQSYAAAVAERGGVTLKDLLSAAEKREKSLLVMLDSIFDPQNMGSILRAAECFGADALIYSKNRGASITPVVSKASVGASELLDCVRVSNLSESAEQLKKAGYWLLCADVGEGAEDLYHIDFPEKTVLILGSEGEGARPLLKKRSDMRVAIPMVGAIDSLNVSQAAAVFFAFYRRQYPI